MLKIIAGEVAADAGTIKLQGATVSQLGHLPQTREYTAAVVCGMSRCPSFPALARTGCEIHDAAALASRADLALDIARQFGDHELELRARAGKGRVALPGLRQQGVRVIGRSHGGHRRG